MASTSDDDEEINFLANVLGNHIVDQSLQSLAPQSNPIFNQDFIEESEFFDCYEDHQEENEEPRENCTKLSTVNNITTVNTCISQSNLNVPSKRIKAMKELPPPVNNQASPEIIEIESSEGEDNFFETPIITKQIRKSVSINESSKMNILSRKGSNASKVVLQGAWSKIFSPTAASGPKAIIKGRTFHSIPPIKQYNFSDEPSIASLEDEPIVAKGKARAPSTAKAKAKERTTSAGKGAVPYHKKIPGTNFVVDAFSYGTVPKCTGYFLTHFHSDHYGGLTANFEGDMIYCTATTGALAIQELNVPKEKVTILPLDETVEIDGVKVTLIDANHCPGAAMLIFETSDGKRCLHCGDFRASEQLILHPQLHVKPFDMVFLDTTYFDDTYCFPPQDTVVNDVAQWVKEEASKNPENRYLVVVGTYKIGKEKIAIGIAEAMNSKIYVPEDRKKVYDQMVYPEFLNLITGTSEGSNSMVHMTGMFNLSSEKLSKYLDSFVAENFTHVIAIKPTGWNWKPSVPSGNTVVSIDPLNPPFKVEPSNVPYVGTNFRTQMKVDDRIQILNAPYSEHSSFAELKRFGETVKSRKWKATVGGSVEQWISRNTYLKTWAIEE